MNCQYLEYHQGTASCPCNCHQNNTSAGCFIPSMISPETWEERLNEVLVSSDVNALSDFIRAEKEKSKREAESSAYERVIEELGKMSKEYLWVGDDPETEETRVMNENEESTWGADMSFAYNLALSEAVERIKKLH